jgi:signal transduction histidine kinase
VRAKAKNDHGATHPEVEHDRSAAKCCEHCGHAVNEDALVDAALLRLHDLLQTPQPENDILLVVNRFCIETLGCDFSSTYIHDPERDVYRLACNVGAREEVQKEFTEVEFPRGSLPLIEHFSVGSLVEIEDTEKQKLVPVVLFRSLRVSSTMFVPIAGMGGIAAIWAFGYRKRTGSFSSLQRRLALGIAQVSAKALDNARLIESYRQASELKSAFLATLSHELRTPVHVILGMMECLKDEGLQGEQAEFASTVDRQARVLASMIDDLLDLSAIEANRVELAQDSFDPRTVVEATITDWADKAGAKGLVLSSSVRRGVPHAVVGDPRRLGQILGNLLSNAVKYTETGSIEVTLGEISEESSRTRLRFAVRDTGIGIAPEGQRRLFEAFSRVHPESHRHYGGTGLGLAICKRLAALFDGEIGVESQIGEGSTFWFTVRLERRDRRGLLAARPSSAGKRPSVRAAGARTERRRRPDAHSPA